MKVGMVRWRAGWLKLLMLDRESAFDSSVYYHGDKAENKDNAPDEF